MFSQIGDSGVYIHAGPLQVESMFFTSFISFACTEPGNVLEATYCLSQPFSICKNMYD